METEYDLPYMETEKFCGLLANATQTISVAARHFFIRWFRF